MSVGYSKTADGRMRYLFGPLNQKGGERRLNVAVTRAKRRLTLVSSFTFLDMDPNRLNAAGARLLRSYLEYVQLGGISDSRNATVNAFEADVRDRLIEAGVPVEARYGVDFAASHFAVETDGARYHSSPTARDRDRLRQQHLERLGWRYHRIWSVDWHADREREIARAVAAYAESLQPIEPEPEPVVEVDKPPVLKTRGPKPELPPFDSITDLPDHMLAELVKWVESDGLNRTEDEVVTETIAELGFTRRGSRIVEAVKRARQSLGRGFVGGSG
jgi:restriction endonuclease-like protein